MTRILAWHQGSVGDLILSLPALRAIRRRHPGVSLHLICRPALHDIITFNGLADHMISHEDGRLAGLFNGTASSAAGYLRGYNAAYIFSRSGGVLHDIISSHIRETVQVMTIPPAGLRVHAGWYQLQQIPAEAADDFRPLQWPAPPSSADDGRVICLQPGSGGRGKCWPLERYFTLVKQLGLDGYVVRILLGPAEEEGYAGQIAALSAEIGPRVEVIRQASLTSVAAHLKSAVCYIGNDSGITHLAGALGAPGVAVFGPTDHVIWRPWGDSIAAVHSALDCAPCGEGHRGCKEMKCLQDITVREVASVVSVLCQRAAVKAPGRS